MCINFQNIFVVFTSIRTKHPGTYFSLEPAKICKLHNDRSQNACCACLMSARIQYAHSCLSMDIPKDLTTYFDISQCAVHSKTRICVDQGLCFPQGWECDFYNPGILTIMYFPKMSEDTFLLGAAHFVKAQIIDCRYSLEPLHWAFRQFLHQANKFEQWKPLLIQLIAYSLFQNIYSNKIRNVRFSWHCIYRSG